MTTSIESEYNLGISERKQREKEQKRNLILDSAEKLFFNNGYSGTSVDDIAKEAEYSKGTIYLYFKSKEEIIANIHLRGMSLMFNMFREYSYKGACGIEKLEKIGRANFDFMKNYPNYYELMTMFDSMELDYSKIGSVLMDIGDKGKNIIEYMVSCVIEGQQDGSVKKSLDPLKTAHILAGSSSGIFHWIMNLKSDPTHPELFSDEELFNSFFEFMHLALKS